LDVAFLHDVQVQRLEPLIQNTIVRIVQESLNNVVRHARTKAANVELLQEGNTLRVTVSDRGVGFDTKQVAPDRFGLAGIRERARLFGGKASIHSRPGKGTTIIAEFPLKGPAGSAT
jgi:two-component system sensor kinase